MQPIKEEFSHLQQAMEAGIVFVGHNIPEKECQTRFTVQSLEESLRRITFSQEHIILWRSIYHKIKKKKKKTKKYKLRKFGMSY